MSKVTVAEIIDQKTVHVSIGGFSVSITKTDEGVVADIWERGFEGTEPLESTYSFDSELQATE